MGAALGLARAGVLKTLEDALDVAWDENITCASGVVPLEGKATIAGAPPIAADMIVHLEGQEQRIGIRLGGVSNSKIVDD